MSKTTQQKYERNLATRCHWLLQKLYTNYVLLSVNTLAPSSSQRSFTRDMWTTTSGLRVILIDGETWHSGRCIRCIMCICELRWSNTIMNNLITDYTLLMTIFFWRWDYPESTSMLSVAGATHLYRYNVSTDLWRPDCSCWRHNGGENNNRKVQKSRSNRAIYPLLQHIRMSLKFVPKVPIFNTSAEWSPSYMIHVCVNTLQ